MNGSKVVPITFPKPLLTALRLVAAHEERSIASIVREACRRYLQGHEAFIPLMESGLIPNADVIALFTYD